MTPEAACFERRDVQALVDQFDAQGVQPYEALGVLGARHAMEAVTRLQSPKTHVQLVEDLLVPGEVGLLPARLYHPDPSQTLPLVVYIHGGGWALGSVRAADGSCRKMAALGNCAVVAIEYRLAPETKFPGALNDCVSAVRWMAHNAQQWAVDTGTIVLVGDSAGGNLVVSTILELQNDASVEFAAQILIYPSLAPAKDSPFASYRLNADAPLIPRSTMRWFWDLYLRDESDSADPRASPLLAEDLSGMPPTKIYLAELDTLKDEGLSFAERLGEAGVHTDCRLYEGAIHGFWWMDAALEQANELNEQIGTYLRTLS